MAKFAKLSTLTAILTYFLIVLGAAVRVTDSGMSCPDWPHCYGVWWPFPLPEVAIDAGYVTYQVFLEWVHRLLASVVGFFVLGILFYAVRYKKESMRSFVWTLIAFALLGSQVMLGGLTVLKSNVNWSVAAHLGNALLFFGALIVLRKSVALTFENPGKFPSSRGVRFSVWVFTISVFVTMLLGAMVSSSYAGGVCGGLLSCAGDWMPTEDMGQLLHMKHRYMVLVTLLFLGVFVYQARIADEAVKKSATGLLILTGGQVFLGTLTLYSFSHYAWGYQALSVFHLAWGTLLFMACVGTLSKLYWGKGGSFHAQR